MKPVTISGRWATTSYPRPAMHRSKDYMTQIERCRKMLDAAHIDLLARGWQWDGFDGYSAPELVVAVDLARPGSDTISVFEVDYAGLEARIVAWYNGQPADDAPNSTTGGQDF